jgi:RimJ/RimL family protein N-acetyltransferase
MTEQDLWSVSWTGSDGLALAFEPTRQEVAAASPHLSGYYNDTHNRAMMAHGEDMSQQDVVEHYEGVWGEGGHNFLLDIDGELMGDADLRHVDMATRTAEFAIMIGQRATQGRGMGTRFTLMLHALAFGALGLERIYITIIPANKASQRLFEKIGYEIDNSVAARDYIDEEDDITMSFGREQFQRLHGTVSAGMVMKRRVIARK